MMSRAFCCERCDEFYDGFPTRIKIREYRTTTLSGWSGGTDHHKLEICDGCMTALEESIEEWLEDGYE